MSRRWLTCCQFSSAAVQRTPLSAPKSRLVRSCSACPAPWRNRASTRRHSVQHFRDLIALAGGVAERPATPSRSAWWRGGFVRRTSRTGCAAHPRRRPCGRAHARLRGRDGARRHRGYIGFLPHRSVLPSRVMRSVRALPRRNREAARSAANSETPIAVDGHRASDAAMRRSVASARPRQRNRVRDQPTWGHAVSEPVAPPRRLVELTIDGETVRAAEGTTLLDACTRAGLRHSDPVLRRDVDTEERVSRVHGRGRRFANAGPVVQPQGRSGHGREHRHRTNRLLPAHGP